MTVLNEQEGLLRRPPPGSFLAAPLAPALPERQRTLPEVVLRPFSVADLDEVFSHLSDPASVHIAGLTLREPGNRAEFDAAWRKVLADSELQIRAVLADGQFAGHVACYRFQGDWEVGYWIARRWWGKGVASEALRQLLAVAPQRPLNAHVLVDNIRSLRVLRKHGFQTTGQTPAFAWGRRKEVMVEILRLD
ncbi:GNAT family N-acetyltransferase [Roseateles sp. SL47]|uniref:GNAT family N-acetyltransferase n=1 Tax=Roseateles sp. SL47 TaxID=2995138 RepID=UPI002270CF73|nr:GNAT family N-acetyltransferase [Roseateles sp. SL47]WAC71582.1 GNAT family N-acetyltransferase [Roseateles sp. SL47]